MKTITSIIFRPVRLIKIFSIIALSLCIPVKQGLCDDEPLVTSNVPPIYVSIVRHIEEGTDFTANSQAFWSYRTNLINLVNTIKAGGGKFNFQSDWTFLSAALVYDQGTNETNGKNILRWITEDKGFGVDPHAHENRLNYADVAYLIYQLGVNPTNLAGGFIATPLEKSVFEHFRSPIVGTVYPYEWQAEIVWGAASPGHTPIENTVKASGIWRPKDSAHFMQHDPNGSLINIGGYGDSWDALDDLLAKQQAGKLNARKMYTATIMVSQGDLTNPGFLSEFQSRMQSYQPYVQAGLIRWTELNEAVSIWQTLYRSRPNIYRYRPAVQRPK